MESSLKRRVVGALVLIALAVIIVPAWLDGSARHMRDETAFVVPLPPPTRAVTTESVDIGQPLPRADGEIVVAPSDTVKTLRKLDEVAPADSAGEGAEQVDAQPENETPAPTPLASWIVQVGSFASEANANALVERLRDGGLAAFKRDFTSNNEKVHRVLVGPYIRQSEADDVKKTIDSKYQLKSFVASWRD
ncbi:MAG: SPOR domain-containing protein [Pseudomonadota bacterium]